MMPPGPPPPPKPPWKYVGGNPMGCSPPSWWYEDQHNAELHRLEREKQARITETIKTIQEMSDEEKKQLREALGLDN
jgi:hypothetical protein